MPSPPSPPADEQEAIERHKPKDHVGHYLLGWEKAREFFRSAPPADVVERVAKAIRARANERAGSDVALSESWGGWTDYAEAALVAVSLCEPDDLCSFSQAAEQVSVLVRSYTELTDEQAQWTAETLLQPARAVLAAVSPSEGRAREVLPSEPDLPRHVPEDKAYDLRQRFSKAIRWLREAEDIARIEMPAWPTADRIRDIYDQITDDLLNGRVSVPPLKARVAEIQKELDEARALLAKDDRSG